MKTYKEITEGVELNEGKDLASFSSSAKKKTNVLITQFSSAEDGVMAQVGVGMKYIQLTKADAAKVAKELDKWSKS